jgi:membrane protease YdiL (CAAX protease family)
MEWPEEERPMSRVWRFLAWTFAIDWGGLALFLLLGGEWNTAGSTLFALAYMFVPLVVAGFLARGEERGLKEALGIRITFSGWWLAAWLLPVVVAVGALGVALLFPGVAFTSGVDGMIARFGDSLTAEQIEQMRTAIEEMPIHPYWLALAQGLVAGPTINAVAGFGEEAGWRGYVYGELRSRGFWWYSGAVGAVWGLWHAPIILQGHNYPDHPVAGVGMMIVFCLLYSPLFTFIRDRTGSSVGAAVLHGSLNATMGLAVIPLKGGSDLLVSGTGLAGFVVLGALNLLLWGLLRARPALGEPLE